MYSQINFYTGSNLYLNLYCFFLYCFLLLISLRGNIGVINREQYNFRSFLLFCGIILFALTSFINDDFFHYYETMGEYKNGVMDEQHLGVEMPYQHIIYFIQGNYALFRLIVWGGSLLLILLGVKIFGTNAYNTMFLVLVGYIIIYSYARATLAMSIYALGVIIVSVESEHKFNLLKKIIGIAIIALSIYFHRSMITVVIASLFIIFLPYKRNFAKNSLIIFPLIVFLFSTILRIVIDDLSTMSNSFIDDETGILSKMEHYEELTTATSNFFGYIGLILKYSTFYIPFFIIANRFRTSPEVINIRKRGLFLYLITYIIIAIATSMLFLGFSNSILFYRYLFMSFIPLCILISYMRKYRMLGHRQYNAIVCCLVLSNLFQLFTAVYSKI